MSNHCPSTMTRVFLLELSMLSRGIILFLGTHIFLGRWWLVFSGSLLDAPLDDADIFCNNPTII